MDSQFPESFHKRMEEFSIYSFINQKLYKRQFGALAPRCPPSGLTPGAPAEAWASWAIPAFQKGAVVRCCRRLCVRAGLAAARWPGSGCRLVGTSLSHNASLMPLPAVDEGPAAAVTVTNRLLSREHSAGMLPSSPPLAIASPPPICRGLAAPAARLPATLHPPRPCFLCDQQPHSGLAEPPGTSHGNDGAALAAASRAWLLSPPAARICLAWLPLLSAKGLDQMANYRG